METVKLIADPAFAIEPATGISAITSAVVPDCIVTVPTVKFEARSVAEAAACVSPTTFGTEICTAPLGGGVGVTGVGSGVVAVVVVVAGVVVPPC
jgi:hypothetical protein